MFCNNSDTKLIYFINEEIKEWMLFVRLLRISLIGSLCLFILAGCLANSSINHAEKASAFGNKININGDVEQVEVAIAKEKGFNHKHEKFFMTLDQGQALDDFLIVLQRSRINHKEETDENPTYDLQLTFSDEEQLTIQLLLGAKNEPSAFIIEDNPEELYWVDKEDTKILIDIFQVFTPNQMNLYKQNS